MLPEWMSELPADLAHAWLVMPRPAGQRCLVVSAGGQTTARRRNGAILARFPSALPGGRRSSGPDARSGASAFCVLDCVYDAAHKCYHVLDVMVWRGYMLYDCHAQFRIYWAHTKLDEVRAGARARTNPCVFAAVPYYECRAASVRALYESEWPFVRDGLLFVHRETVYESGFTPLLLLWTDARCSARFFDFNSEGMERELKRSPAKRETWKEGERALTFEELESALLAAERSGGDQLMMKTNAES
jgi:snurportin-1